MKKKYTKLLVLILMMGIGFTACRKSEPMDKTEVKEMKDLVVNPDFKWETTQDVVLKISINDPGFLPLKSRVSFYIQDPLTGGDKIISGSISPSEAFQGMIRIPSYIKDLYLALETSTGIQRVEKVAISNGSLEFVFVSTKGSAFNPTPFKSVADPGPECNNCDVVLSGTGNVSITGGKTYCVTDSFTGSVSFETWNGGGTLKVCGTANINGTLTLGTNSHIMVTQNGSLTLGGVSMWGSNPSITVYSNASLQINSGLTTSGVFINHGQTTIKGSLVLQQLSEMAINNGNLTVLNGSVEVNGKQLTNNGTLTTTASMKFNTNANVVNNGSITTGNSVEVNGSVFTNENELIVKTGYFNINSGSKVINRGSIDVQQDDINFNSSVLTENRGSMHAGKDININSNSKVTNFCKMVADNKIEINSGQFLIKNGYLFAATRITLNGSGNVNIEDASMISTKNLVMNATIYGSGNTSTVLATEKIHINSNNVFSGAIEAASAQLFISQNTPPANHLLNGATFVSPDNMQNFIPVTACNPEGVGSEGIVDMDNDGVPDDIDEFPTDPERAFISWYPAEGKFSTLAYEDLWPGMGDFDFNDAVIEFQYEMVTNAANALVDLNGKFKLMAAGASLNNGFAVALPFASNKVASVTGGKIVGETIGFAANGTELGHTNENVIVVYDAIVDAYGEILNTVIDRPYVETDIINIELRMATPQANFGAAPFNPFLFIDQERGKEVHLIDHQPTALVNSEFFGMWDDRSAPGQGSYYQTSGRLPWAIEIPVSFDYPIEKVDILVTYLKFAEWAMSSGTEFQDWYLDKSGYRNAENIYPKPSDK